MESPWKAHEWMEEARNRLDIYDAPYHDQFESAVQSINALWRKIRYVTGMTRKIFGKMEKFHFLRQMLESLFDD